MTHISRVKYVTSAKEMVLVDTEYLPRIRAHPVAPVMKPPSKNSINVGLNVSVLLITHLQGNSS